MIIDTHTHIYNQKDLKSYLLKAKNRVSKIFIMHEPIGIGGDSRVSLEQLLEFVSRNTNLFLLGSIDMTENVGEQLKKLEKLLQRNKIIGIKLYPGYQYFYPFDRKIYPIAKLCQKYKKPLVFHSGDVYDPKGKAILKYSHPIYVDELAVKFPELKLVICHFGFPYLLETASIVCKNKNIYTDISGTITNGKSSKEEIRALTHQYKKDLEKVFVYFPEVKEKVMFGTDYWRESTPLNQVEPYIKVVEQIFNQKEQKNVFSLLGARLFDLE